MKLCFSTLGCVNRSLEEIISLANKYSVKMIEIRGIGGIINNSEIEELSEKRARKTKEKLAAAGITPFILGTSASFHNPEFYDAKMKEGRESAEIAARLGIKNIRVFGDRIEGNREECISRVINGLCELCNYAATLGVSVFLEIHGDFNTVENVLPVALALQDKENFGIIWDIEHTHKTYGTDWEKFYLALRTYIKHVHIKDFSDSRAALSAIGEGDIPISSILSRLKKDGYTGAVSLEWEEKWHPELGRIEPALDSFTAMVKEIENVAD